MQVEIESILDKMLSLIQNQEYENAEQISSVLTSNEFLKLISLCNRQELNELVLKTEFAIGILNTQKELVLDELTLIRKGKKALKTYGD